MFIYFIFFQKIILFSIYFKQFNTKVPPNTEKDYLLSYKAFPIHTQSL